jgi:hypothetical protein
MIGSGMSCIWKDYLGNTVDWFRHVMYLEGLFKELIKSVDTRKVERKIN